jgi:serine/threonine-protein kinase HipA
MERCLYCYRELSPTENDFHPACAMKMFGTRIAPVLPYRSDEIEKLAEQVIRSQTTVTGVQPKLSLHIEKGSKAGPSRFTIVGLWGKYILKPQTSLYPELPENEDITMHLAELAGIRVVPHSLIRLADGALCYITKRIDRTEAGVKLPMEDMCQLTERLTEYKYRGSHEQIAKIILKYSSTPMLDLANYWQLVLFCQLTGNNDMHLKNFSLVSTEEGRYTLAPAYDLLAAVLALPQDTEELALTLGGKKRNLSRPVFEKAFTTSGLDPKVVADIFLGFEDTYPKWRDLIAQSFLSAEYKEKYLALLDANCLNVRLSVTAIDNDQDRMLKKKG